MKKKIIITTAVVLAMAIAVFAVVMVGKSNKLDTFMENVKISDVDLSNHDDGEYNGKVNAGIIVVEVMVNIKDSKIVSIDILKHQNGQGGDAGKITDGIIDEQRIDVDVISGATLSSRVIQKAVEEALK